MTIKLRVLTWLVGIALPILAGCTGVQTPPATPEQQAARDRLFQNKARFEEKCRTEAGEKIYRTVKDVEGLVLLKVRPRASDREWSDLMWPGAAFAIEAREDDYINTFLGYEYAPGDGQTGKPIPITATSRGYINTDQRSEGLPGYRYVDVIAAKDGKRYRYSGRWEEPWQYDKSYLKGYIKFFLDKAPAPAASPRYGVTYEDHVIPEDRALGIASSTVKVIDLQTQEVLGELTRYAWTMGGASRANPSPWLTAYKCPGHAVGSDAATRKFVDQILIPRKEK